MCTFKPFCSERQVLININKNVHLNICEEVAEIQLNESYTRKSVISDMLSLINKKKLN